MITDGQVIEINYTLTTDEGEVIDETKSRSPLSYIQGKKNILPELEKQIAKEEINKVFKVRIEADKAYGQFDNSLVQSINKEQFGENVKNLKLGMQFEMETEDKNAKNFIATIIEIKENEVILDGNHPLAGEALNFEVEILSLRQATEDELKVGSIKLESTCCDTNGGCC